MGSKTEPTELYKFVKARFGRAESESKRLQANLSDSFRATASSLLFMVQSTFSRQDAQLAAMKERLERIEVLLRTQHVIVTSDEHWATFMAILDAPAQAYPEIVNLRWLRAQQGKSEQSIAEGKTSRRRKVV